jgi:hypothetical protein
LINKEKCLGYNIMSQSARLINKKKKSIYYHNTESVYNASDESRMLYGDSGNDDMYYNSTGNLGSDSKKQNIFSDIFSSSIDYTS